MKSKPSSRKLLTLTIVSAVCAQLSYASNSSAETVQLLIEPEFAVMKAADYSVVSDAWLKANSKQLGLSDLTQLRLREVKDSLTARHFYYQQTLNDLALLNAEVIVSVSHDDRRISKVFNSAQTVELAPQLNKHAGLSLEQAQETAWQHLQGSGLQVLPKAQLLYVKNADGIHLAYRVQISAELPHGAWNYLIDANTAQVLKAQRIDTPNKRVAEINPGQFVNKNHKSLLQEISALNNKLAPVQKIVGTKALADGQAKVFDPDPRTTLNDATLADTSPVLDFESAYLPRTLKELSVDAGIYSLSGPWVKIAEIEAPIKAPSTTVDGNWTAFRRGNNAFNDAMTYFHIDQSQRYIQSLGFTGTKGIQQRAIPVDTDGFDGTDNSHFDPNGNTLAFGHGGVDDNEDADVILHEYGHAIQYSINNNWDGGDTGAMGEGFGDYWAGSYSITTTNGATFNPNWVFTWDGHNDFWDGRLMNQTSFRYDSTQTYPYHEVINGVLGDELWSTPLFQTLLDLIAVGRTREEVDRIILEAHFGLGANLKMPDMANSILLAAKTLYPTGPHEEAFRTHFEQMNLLNRAPSIELSSILQTVTSGAAVSFIATINDPDGDSTTVLWERMSGPEVTLSGATTNSVSFTAPTVTTVQTVTLRLTATDSKGSATTKTVSATINPPASPSGGGGGGGSVPLVTGLLAMLALCKRRR